MMTKNDYLSAWGYLEALKTCLREKAKTAADNRSKTTSKATADLLEKAEAEYMKTIVDISDLQRKIDDTSADME